MATDDSLALEMRAKPPWEAAPLDAPARFHLYSVIATLCIVFAFSMIIAILGFALLREAREVQGGIISSAIGWVGMIACTWGIARLSGRLSDDGWLVRCTRDGYAFQFIPLGMFRDFSGPASIEFVPEGMTMTGNLGSNRLPDTGIELLAHLFHLSTFGIFILAFLGRGTETEEVLLLRKENIAAIRCKGPFVAVRFRRSPFPGLKGIRLFVAPRAAQEFFREFQENFPGLLPESYRAALDQPQD
jgi:hypothetical protein